MELGLPYTVFCMRLLCDVFGAALVVLAVVSLELKKLVNKSVQVAMNPHDSRFPITAIAEENGGESCTVVTQYGRI